MHDRTCQGENVDDFGQLGQSINFDSADIGEPDLGHIVEDNLLRDTLLHSVVASPRAELTTNVLLESVRPVTDGVQVGLDNGETIAATLLIAADGNASRVRSLLGMPIGRRDYTQQAVVTHVASELPHEETALQRFLPGGPLALLPLADGRSSVVWSMPERQAGELIGVSDAAFLAALQTASGGVLGELGPISKRTNFPLQMVHALRYCQDSVVLVGDAAHCVHPLAGQGMNLGLLDAACLADEIERAYLGGRGPGDLAVLRRYERRRKGDNLRMMLALDAIDRLFRLPSGFTHLRELGLGAVNRSLTAKRVLMRRALGLDHRLPHRASPASREIQEVTGANRL